jgi:aminopeptidase N
MFLYPCVLMRTCIAPVLPQMDKINHQVASRVAGAFTSFKQYDAHRQGLMLAQLRRIAAVPGLSDNVYEIVNKSLQQA